MARVRIATVDTNGNIIEKIPLANVNDLQTSLDGKVDKVAGKSLTSNDFTTDYKTKLDNIEIEANKYILPTASDITLGGVKVDGVTITVTDGVISGANTLSEITETEIDIGTGSDLRAITGRRAKYMLDKKQDKLVSGSNIKTINGQDITGSGNLEITSNTVLESMPIGGQIPFAGTVLPTNFLWCRGQAVSRTIYADLFAAVGTTYGSGDGSTTFNVPDKRGRVSAGYKEGDATFGTLGNKLGSETVALTVGQLPKFTPSGSANNSRVPIGTDHDTPWGSSGFSIHNNGSGYSDGGGVTIYSYDHSHSLTMNQIGNNEAHNNIQPTEIDNWIIKAKNTEGVLPVTGQIIDGYGSTSTVDASSAANATDLDNRILSINTLMANMFNFETKTFGGATWMKVYYTNSMNGTVLWTDLAELGQSFQSYKWSILGLIEKFRNTSFGGFEFMMEIPGEGNKYNRWRQSSNPLLAAAETVTGYSAITIQMNSNGWYGGIAKSSSAEALLDGSNAGWWYCIGQKVNYSGGIPGATIPVQEIYLWLRIA